VLDLTDRRYQKTSKIALFKTGLGTRFSRLGGIFDKVGENYRKFKQLLREVLDEIGGIYYKFGKNSEQIGGEFRALLQNKNLSA
jgi:hypothetical protein